MVKAATKELVIPAIDLRDIKVRIVGESSLITHAWDEKVKRQMLEKQMGKAKSKGHDVKNPVGDFIASMYWLDGMPSDFTEEGFAEAMASGKARFGFPASAFKAAAVAGAYRAKVTKDKVSMYGAFRILEEYVEIKGTPIMREDMVRVANGAPDIRFRGEFPEWEAELAIRYNAGVLTDEQLINILNLGGFSCGVGEWRMEKGGDHGAFRVASVSV